MKFELDLSDTLVRKLRALNILVGGDPRALPEFVAQLINKTVTDAIVQSATGDIDLPETPAAPAHLSRTTPSRSAAPQPLRPQEDLSGISEGLGDEEEEEIKGETDPMAMVPRRGALSEDQVDRDMSVEDPGHEAKTEAPNSADPDMRAEEEFASILGVEVPAEPTTPKNRGKRRVDTRRVTGFTGAERNAF